MMGRRKSDQDQLFYEFHLSDAVPGHLSPSGNHHVETVASSDRRATHPAHFRCVRVDVVELHELRSTFEIVEKGERKTIRTA
jgi:hypothetical protein